MSSATSMAPAAAYEGIIRLYALPELGRARLQSVDGAALNRLYHRLLTEGRTESRRGLGAGLSPKTVRNVHGVLTRAMCDAVRWGQLQRNPVRYGRPTARPRPGDEGVDG